MTARGLVAVTGATGFLGSHVLAALDDAGWRLRILCRRHPVLPTLSRGVEVVGGDLGDEASLDRLVAGADAVVHMAGAIKAADARAFMAVNAGGTARLAAAWRARAAGARFVLVSSLAAREPGLSAYAASKRAGETALAEAAGPDAGLAILRPAAVYGEGDRETLAIFRAARLPVQPLLAGPSARVALIHAADVASAVAAALGPAVPRGPWELGDARLHGYGWAEIAGAAAAALGRTARPVRLPGALVAAAGHAGDLWQRVSGRPAMLTTGKLGEIGHDDWATRAENRLPPEVWAPSIDLSEGFARTVRWYRENGWL